MSWLLPLVIVLPVATAVATFLCRNASAARWLSVAGSAALLALSVAVLADVWRSGVVAVQVGDWPAPFGTTLVADPLSAVMLVMTATVGLAVAVYAVADIDARLGSLGYHTLFQVLLAGVCGAFIAGDIFNLYVWFEVMLIASFGLLVLGGERTQLAGGVKYVALNLVSTVLFLSGIGFLYGMTGTLNLAHLHLAVQQVENPGLLTVVAVLFMVAFGIKAAVFPLFFWLPASYHTPRVAVSAVFAGLLTKVGVYALIRVFTLIFNHDTDYTHGLLLVVAGLNTAISLFYYLRVIKVMAIDPPQGEGRAARIPLVSVPGLYAAVITAPVLLLIVQIGLGFVALAIRNAAGKTPENIANLGTATVISVHVLLGAMLTVTIAALAAHVFRATRSQR